MTRRATSRVRAAVWAALLATLLTTVPTSAHATPGGAKGRGEEHRSERASQALEAAKSLFSPKLDRRTPRGLRGLGADADAGNRAGQDTMAKSAALNATQVLRELALSMDALPPSERRVAEQILARPTDTRSDGWPGIKYDRSPAVSSCSSTTGDPLHVCVHWVTDPDSPDAPPLVDADGDGVPDWVSTTQQVLEEVWQHIRSLGYRTPVDDGDTAFPGPDRRLDVYLADLLPYDLYGYCAPESPLRGRAAPAYCVIDDDFVGYPGDPIADLKVTVAHEFFHTVQFAYDVFADLWLQEGTAAWIEDEVYDDIDDNLQYLPISALQHPGVPLDYIEGGITQRYGSWIWWRFLSEYFGSGASEDPSVVRQIWQHVGNGERSLVAQRRVLHQRGTSFTDMFAEFSAANRIAGRWYDEGRKYVKFVAPVAGRFVLTRNRQQTPWLVTRLTHLSSRHVVVVPGRSLKGQWGLRMLLDLPPRFRGSKATVMVHHRNGRIGWRRVVLNRAGDARLRVPFTRRRVARVALSLTNASTRVAACGSQPGWSCGGIPRDDGRDGAGLPFTFKVRAVR